MSTFVPRDDGSALSTMVADALVDAGLFDVLVRAAARTLRALPSAVAAWLGPEAHTSENSHAPTIAFREDGPWNGVIVVEADEASFWLLVKAGPGTRTRRHVSTARPINDPFGHGQGRWQFDERPAWSDPHPYETPFTEADLWRR